MLCSAPAGAQTAPPAAVRDDVATGTVQFVPRTQSPADCLRSANGVCAYDVTGTESSTAYQGPGHLTEHLTIDFTQPRRSAAGVCFPQLGTGTMHTADGDYRFFNQGETCAPPAPIGADGWRNGYHDSAIYAGTGVFANVAGTLSITVIVHAPDVAVYHSAGALVPIPPH